MKCNNESVVSCGYEEKIRRKHDQIGWNEESSNPCVTYFTEFAMFYKTMFFNWIHFFQYCEL